MKLGVIGGLGPMATACFLEMITKMTEAQCDQDHLEILIHSAPYIPAPIIHGIYETGLELQKNGIKRAGLMATDGTIESRIFQDQLEKMGIEVLLPDERRQQDIMDVIYKNLKAGLPADMEKFQKVSLQLKDQGAQVILLGCTELSLIKKDVPLGKEYLDALEVLAQRCVVRCGKKLKKEYENLLMPEE